MAKTRMINTRFWNDGYISELKPVEKLLFLYFLTNQATSICGIYELPLRTVAFETGIEEQKVRDILSRFSVDGKIEYWDGWVVIKNFVKHQNQRSPQIIKGIRAELENVPEQLKRYTEGIDTLLHSNSNSNLIPIRGEKPHASLEFLSNLPESDLKELSEKYEASPASIRRKAETMKNYCLSKGKTYKNYRAFLENGLDKDFGRRAKLQPKQHEVKPIVLDAEALARVDKVKAEIRQLAAVKRV